MAIPGYDPWRERAAEPPLEPPTEALSSRVNLSPAAVDTLPWVAIEENEDGVYASIAGEPFSPVERFRQVTWRPDAFVVETENGQTGIWYSPTNVQTRGGREELPYPQTEPFTTTPWRLGIAPDEHNRWAPPDDVRRARAERRLELNEVRLAEAEDPSNLWQNYLYQRLKPWESRPWVRDPNVSPYDFRPLPDASGATEVMRDQLFALYGLQPSAARFLEQAELAIGNDPSAKDQGHYVPLENRLQVQNTAPALLMHEYVHAFDPDMWSVSRSLPLPFARDYDPSFRAALEQLDADPSPQAQVPRFAISQYPGDWQNFPWEAYAEIAATSQGRLDDMPEYLRPFYDYLYTGSPRPEFYQRVSRYKR